MGIIIGRKVQVVKKNYIKKGELEIEFVGDLNVIDKVMTCSSEYYGIPSVNNASFEVYVGESLNENGEFKIVLFKPTDIKKII